MTFLRRPNTARPTDDASADPEELDPETQLMPGKGRPTPKRRDAQQRRRTPVAAPTSRREAYRMRRAGLKEERRTTRRALVSGDESKLPPRDAGPVKRLVRDIVDSRRSVAGMFLPMALVALVLSSARSAAAQALVILIYLVIIVAIVMDSILLVRRVKRTVRERHGASAVVGVGSYAVMRSLQFRRFRMPPPKVRRGQPIRP